MVKILARAAVAIQDVRYKAVKREHADLSCGVDVVLELLFVGGNVIVVVFFICLTHLNTDDDYGTEGR